MSDDASVEASPEFADAKRILESKKRFLTMALQEGRGSSAESQVQQFHSAVEQHKNVLQKHSKYWPEIKEYCNEINQQLKVVLVTEEWEGKVRSWKGQLQRQEIGIDEFDPRRGNNYTVDQYTKTRTDIEQALSRSDVDDLYCCKDFKAFATEWKDTIKPRVDTKVAEIEKGVEWKNICDGFGIDSSTDHRFLRKYLENVLESPGNHRNDETLLKSAEKHKEALNKIDLNKWKAFGPAKKCIEEMESLIDRAYSALDGSDNATKEKDEAKKAAEKRDVQEKIDLCSTNIINTCAANLCTFTTTGSSFVRQPYFSCFTCGSGYAVCVTCRYLCHPADHNIGSVTVGDAYCDCGSSGKCKNLTKSTAGSASAPAAVVCRNGHAVKKIDGRSCSCDICGSSWRNPWACTSCDYDMCESCYQSKLAAAPAAPAAPAPEVLCRGGHPLKKTDGRSCRCDICGASYRDPYSCTSCDYDLCESCYKSKLPTSAPVAVVCRNGHSLKKIDGRSCSCDICGSSWRNPWACTSCDYDLCESCYQSKLSSGGASAATPASNSNNTSTPAPVYAPPPAAAPPVAAQPAGSQLIIPSEPELECTAGLFIAQPNRDPYSSPTEEKWIAGVKRKPAGQFDTSNRRLNSNLRDVFLKWNEWTSDFNKPHEEYLKVREYFYQDQDIDWSYSQMNYALENMERYVSYLRGTIDNAIQLTKATHPAVERMEEERKFIITIIRTHREEGAKEYQKAKFTKQVMGHLKNIRLVKKTLDESKDFTGGTISVDGYYGEYYHFEGQGGGYRNCDIPRIGLEEVKKARELFSTNPEHHLTAEVYQLEKDITQIHAELCLKCARHFVDKGLMDKSSEYRTSYVQVHGETSDLCSLDQYLEEVKAGARQKKEEAEAKARIESEERERAARAEREKLQAIWKDRFSAGGTIFCEQEEWSYDPSGLVKLKGTEVYYKWTGTYLSGSMYGGGSWDGTSFSWNNDNRTIYRYSFNGEKFTLEVGKGIPSFTWNGSLLSPVNPGNKFQNRLVRFDGEVPPLVCIAIALRVWTRHRISDCTGEHVCKSALFSEGLQGKTCENCSTNSRMNCAVCSDYISFPRNIAHCCKYCVTFVSSSCMKCGTGFARVPAFLCDTCQYKFGGANYCTRTKPHQTF